MRDREQRYRDKIKDQGKKQIACWLDGDTYQALQTLIKEHRLRGMGEAIRLLVDNHQGAQEPPQAATATAQNETPPEPDLLDR